MSIYFYKNMNKILLRISSELTYFLIVNFFRLQMCFNIESVTKVQGPPLNLPRYF